VGGVAYDNASVSGGRACRMLKPEGRHGREREIEQMPETTKQEIDAQQAAKLAADYLRTMVPQADDLLLEEVERQTESGEKRWLITLSCLLNPTGSATPGFQSKTFAIGAETGEVLSMKIKTF